MISRSLSKGIMKGTQFDLSGALSTLNLFHSICKINEMSLIQCFEERTTALKKKLNGKQF